MENQIENLKESLRIFAEERNWDVYHNPKNLSMALAGEAGELLDIFQWLTTEESKFVNLNEKDYEKAKEEIADIFLYLIRIADKLNIDLLKVAMDKIELNRKKYPIELSKNNARKYNRR